MFFFAFCVLLACGPVSDGPPTQSGMQADTLNLFEVRTLAAEQDPRAIQPSLLAEASRLRRQNLKMQRLPQVAVTALATRQNETISIDFPTGMTLGPPLSQYRVQAEVDWLLLSGGRPGREAAAERARLAEQIAGVEVSLKALRDGATETYFAALLFQVQAEALRLSVEDLAARLKLVQAHVRDSVALPSDAAALEAEQIQLRQQIEEAEAHRLAALGVLGGFLGQTLPPTTVLAVPDLTGPLSAVHPPSGSTSEVSIQTQELQLLDQRQARLEAEARVVTTKLLPQLSVFGQAGVGRPGPFNFLSDELNEFGIAGVRLRWNVFDWGQARRTARVLRQQATITAHDADALKRRIHRDVQDEQTTLKRLKRTLTDDLRHIALREQILEVAQRQLEEGVLLPALYADRLSDLAAARLSLQRHRIEQARAQARLLSALGHFPGETRTDTSTP